MDNETMILEPYQIENGERITDLIKKYRIAYYAGEVRVRKTGSALYAAKKLGCQRVLCISKKNAIPGIEKQYAGFGFNDYYSMKCINYESVHKVPDIMPEGFDLVIIDEAHSLGQYPKSSLQTMRVRVVCEHKPIIYMSGTPNPETYSQLYHQFWVSSYSPFSKWASFYKWAHEFVEKDQSGKFFEKKINRGLTMNDYSRAKKDDIIKAVDHLFVKYSQQDAGFQGEVKEHILYVNMNPKIYEFAKYMCRKRVYKMKNGDFIMGDSMVNLQNKLHQIYSGTVVSSHMEPGLDGKSAEVRTYHILDRSKVNFIKNHFAGQKIAIFYKFIAEGMMLKEAFPNWTDNDEEFNRCSDKTWIRQFVAGREGQNVSTADAIVALNIDFSATTYWQFRARGQDKDQTKHFNLYWIFAKDGIEEKVLKTVRQKKSYTVNYFKRQFNIAHLAPGYMLEYVKQISQ